MITAASARGRSRPDIDHGWDASIRRSAVRHEGGRSGCVQQEIGRARIRTDCGTADGAPLGSRLLCRSVLRRLCCLLYRPSTTDEDADDLGDAGRSLVDGSHGRAPSDGSIVADVVAVEVELVAVGGFPGSGKSSVASRLADDLRIPLLASDLLGDTIRAVLAEHAPSPVPSSVASRAGYASLFALAEEFVDHGCSVVVDVSLGWAFQWEALDAIRAAHPGVRFLPVILECSRASCLSRLRERHRRDSEHHEPVEDFMRQPQLEAVADYLAAVDRPDVRHIDAERPIDDVYREIRRLLTLPSRLAQE